MVKLPVSGLRIFGAFKLSSAGHVKQIGAREDLGLLTIRDIRATILHVQIFVSFQRLAQKLDFLITLYAPAFSICSASTIPFILV